MAHMRRNTDTLSGRSSTMPWTMPSAFQSWTSAQLPRFSHEHVDRQHPTSHLSFTMNDTSNVNTDALQAPTLQQRKSIEIKQLHMQLARIWLPDTAP